MSDRLVDAFAALERVDVPISWDDVVALESDVDLDVPHVSDLATAAEARSSRRRLTAVAAVAAALVVALVIIVVRADGESDPGVVTVPSTLPPTTSSTPTTNAATSSFRVFPVTAWAGDRYLVWSGEDGSTQIPRADGWAYEPATGESTDIPTAPIAARTEAVGVWTGDELIVCCGASITSVPSSSTDDAAAYRPDTGTWRLIADPPDGANQGFAAAVWTGDQMIVVSPTGGPLLAYDPASDSWRELAAPPGPFGRQPEAVWTGEYVIVWSREPYAPATTDQGYIYDPRTNRWADLPELPPAQRTTWASIAWTGDEVIVYGLSANDESRVGGGRWRPGDGAWRPFRDPGLPPIVYYNGTPGSQTLAWNDATQRLVVWPTHGDEFFSEAMPLLSYDPITDTWQRLGGYQLGFNPDLAIGDGIIFRPDRDNPVVANLNR